MFTRSNVSEPKSSCRASSIQVKSPPFFQPKLTASPPVDAYEQETDDVADQVMRIPSFAPSANKVPFVQRMPLTAVGSVMRACGECEKEKAQRKESGGGGASGKSAPSIVSSVLSSGGGQPMEGGTRQFMESRFGQDFSQVRVHTDSRAAESASAIQARAYTSGQNVVFGSGEYQPSSEGGRRLLAHELTHVIQQNGGLVQTKSSGITDKHIQLQTGAINHSTIQRWSIGDPVPGINTIVCDGAGGITTQIGNIGNADQTACLRDCVEQHEQSHRSDAIAENATICRDVVAGRTVRPNSGAQRNATEIAASNVEIACLRAQLPGANATCTPIINARITQMEGYRDSFR